MTKWAKLAILIPLLLPNVAVALVAPPSIAATSTLQVIITVAFGMVFNPAAPTVVCEAPAATVVANLSTVGGDGNPVTYSLAAGITDFAISGTSIVVGPNGIAKIDCGKTVQLQVTATQQ